MKTLLMTYFRKFALQAFLLLVVQLVNKNPIMAQAPVCDGVTVYAIFNDSIDASKNRPSIISPVNSLTGVVGTPMSGAGISLYHRYQTGPNRYYYGSASLAVDPVAKRFYANSQMINATAKEFFAVSTVIGSAGFNTIATTPSSNTANVPTGRSNGLDDYHFVKMAVNQAGTFIYSLGVIRDTTLSGITASNANVLIRMNTCGITNCATIQLLGYLPPTPVFMSNWHVYNGDMAFDNSGNLYYATVAYELVGGAGRYTDARLFMIKAADIPTTVGTGTIPMSFVADYNILDSTAMDGIAFDGVGAMYMTTKRFTTATGVSTGLTTAPQQSSQLYKTSVAGTATLMPAFTAPATYSIADLASCSFPLTLLASNELVLTGRYTAGNSSLNWTVNDNTNVDHYEVQRSDEGSDFSFTTIARIDPKNTNQGEVSYTYNDPQSGYGNPKFYRVREVMKGGMGLYSQVVKITFNAKISLVGKLAPNPVADHVLVNVQLKSAYGISARLIDQSGRIVYQRSFSGVEGENKITIDHMLGMAAGIYILELTAGEETVRQKLVKQ